MIIGFGHKRFSGKDTCARFAAEYLFKQHNVPFTQINWFAKALKTAAMEAFDFTKKQVYGNLKGVVDPRWGFTPGWALQKMGTEGFRNVFGEDFWIHRLKMALDGVAHHVMIADVRFPNEAEAVKRWGGYLVRVDRNLAPVEDGRDAGHASETSLDGYEGWDAVIDNNGTLDELREKVVKLIDTFIQR